MIELGPPARQPSETVEQYRKRRDNERKVIKLHTKGQLNHKQRTILNAKGQPARAPYVKPKPVSYRVVPPVPIEKGQG